MKQQRRKLNKKILALILALSMVLGQGTGVFATESQNAVQVPVQETEETAPEAEKAAETATQKPQEEAPSDEAEKTEAPAEEAVSAEEGAAGEAGGQQPSTTPEEAKSESMDAAPAEAQTEENVSGNETVSGQTDVEEASGIAAPKDERISLSGGTITVELSTNGMHVAAGEEGNLLNPETLDFTGAAPVTLPVPTHASKYVDKDPIGVDFKVLSSNDPAEPTTLSENDSVSSNDYRVEYRYEYYNYYNEKVVQVVNKDYVPEYQGTAVINISGNGRYKNYIEFYYPYEFKPVKISAGSVEITPAQKSATVKNKEEEASVFVYAVGMSAVSGNREENEYKDFYKEGRALKPGASATIYSYSKADGTESDFSESSNYIIVISTDAMFRPAEAVYQQFMTTSAGGSSDITDALDGYQEIGFKARIDRATQRIKLEWKPAASLGYKAFVLKRLKREDSGFEIANGWSGKSSKKAFEYRPADVEKAGQPAVFMLECYKNPTDVSPAARYITVAAPSLISVATGAVQDETEFCFSRIYENEDDELNYYLDLSTTKDFSSIVASQKIASKYVDILDGYQVGKNVTAAAARGLVNCEIIPGETYYQRVTAQYSYKGKVFTSAPSNVLSRKAGPAKTTIFNINGVRYTKPAGKGTKKAEIDDANISRMNRYLSEMLAMVDDECDFSGYSTMDPAEFVHIDNEGPDKESGYVVFLAPKTTDLKGYELLTSSTPYGKYKKVKLYKTDINGNPAKYSGLYKWDPEDAVKKEGDIPYGSYDWLKEGSGYSVYYAQYNKFNPGKTTYFAVRSVTNKGIRGGFDEEGYECVPELDGIRSSTAMFMSEKRVDVYWTHDCCPTQYRIYRKEYTPVSADTANEGAEVIDTDIKIDDYTLIAKVNNKKAGTLNRENPKKSQMMLKDYTDELFYGAYNKFVDKKIPDGSKEYEYIIVPVLNKKEKVKGESTLSKAEKVCTGYEYNEDQVNMSAYAGGANLAGNSIMAAGGKLENLKAVNLGIKKAEKGGVKITWKKSGAKAYVVLRSDGKPANGNYEHFYTKENSCVDNTATLGKSYRYTVFPVNSGLKEWAKKDWSSSTKSQALSEAANAAYVTGCARPLTQVKGSVTSDSKAHTAYLKWSAAVAPGAVYYEVQCRDLPAGQSDFTKCKWKILRSPKYETTYDDKNAGTLTRGVVRQYRILPCVKVGAKYVYGESAILGYASRTQRLDLAVAGSTVQKGKTTTIKVYPVRTAKPLLTTFNAIKCTGVKGKLEVTGKKFEKDHWVVTVKGLAKGTHNLNITASDYSSGIFGGDSSALSKNIKISVK